MTADQRLFAGELLTPDEMADRLGWEDEGPAEPGRYSPRGRRLVHYLRKRERQKRIALMVRTGHGAGMRYHLSEPHLRKHCDELWGMRLKEVHREMANHLRSINETIDRRAAASARQVVREEVEPRLRTLWDRDEAIAGDVRDLCVAVDRLVGTMKTT